ncbi:hypothetical protein [Noviherbaspirillum denitrificans]|uniref:Uncharacterized protein n=1 Tax=Noviherbaspirillum denitrificans TaxID=1968433 RepID=A0A254THZ9_9BURK|nr:hypothetical protein [Noviherbaspirillum denitrificans]OWW22266.1 hypothetical protein AYR66_24960 [Noviherbaspirillum denitrificans]
MYMVYWTEVDDGKAEPKSRDFASTAMSDAMQFMEALRKRQREGEGICFVTICAENPDSVGHPGVADPSPDYNWKKRRR